MPSSFPRETWKPALLRHQVPTVLYPLITHDGSLTAALKALFPDFGVRVLYQGFRRATLDEACLLGVRRREYAWIREVLLQSGTEPLVFAHTALSRRHLRGPWNLMRRQGNRSLGETLFSSRRIARSSLHYRMLGRDHALVQRNGPPFRPLPARRSLFCHRGAGLLVTEVFLPSGLWKNTDVTTQKWR